MPKITEELILVTITFTGIGQHHPGDSDTSQEPTRRNPHTTTEAIERHIAIEIQEGTDIEVSGVSFKYKWRTSDIIIEAHKYSLHRILASSTTPVYPEDQ